jgi:DNA (cytosine-5)-methyltransferase 1
LRAGTHDGIHANAGVPPAVAFDLRGREGGAMPEGPHDTANIRAASGGSSRSYVAQSWAVRRLTPRECERLQGFPDDFTKIPYRGKPAERCPDGPRYKALGNSWAVNCAVWIAERMDEVDKW